MSAPAGWYPQPDGRERYWDGERWSDSFRMPAPPSPYPAPPAPSSSGAYPEQVAYQQPATYPQPGYAPPSNSGTGLLKGCLVAGIVLALIATAIGMAGFLAMRNAMDSVRDSWPGEYPSVPAQPYDPGTPLDPDAPAVEPTEGLGEAVVVQVGDAFTLGSRLEVRAGWSLQSDGPITEAVNMTGELLSEADAGGFLLVLGTNPDADPTAWCLTEPGGAGSGEVTITCLPFIGDQSGVTQATVIPF